MRATRDQRYFLNYLTMREILQVTCILTEHDKLEHVKGEGSKEAEGRKEAEGSKMATGVEEISSASIETENWQASRLLTAEVCVCVCVCTV